MILRLSTVKRIAEDLLAHAEQRKAELREQIAEHQRHMDKCPPRSKAKKMAQGLKLKMLNDDLNEWKLAAMSIEVMMEAQQPKGAE